MKNQRFLLTVSLALCLIAGSTQQLAASSTTHTAMELIRESNDSLHRTVLDNGAICLVKEVHTAPVVSIQIWVGTGSIHEHEFLGSGLSHAIEHMIFKGTDKLSSTELTKSINDAGGRINAYTSFDRTVFHTDMPASAWKTGLNALTESVMNATFPKKEWTEERKVILREISMGKDSADRVLGKLLWRTAFTSHPYRHPVIGYKEVFSEATRDDLVTFFKRNYVPDNMIVVVVGDIDAAEVSEEITNQFKDFHRRARPPVLLPAEPAQISPRFVRQHGAYKVTRLEWAYHTVPLSHPDAVALDILALIVGQGRSSRLTTRIKEELGLVHNISAWSYTPKQAGLFGITASFDPEKEKDVIDAIQDSIDQWIDTRLSHDEIEKARRRTLVSELSGLQTMKGQANNYASGEFYANNPRFSETYIDLVNKTDRDTVRNVARKYLRKDNRSIVVLCPQTTNAASAAETAIIQHAPKKIILKNGIPLILREDHRLPFVYFTFALEGGLLDETRTDAGITEIMSNLLIRGTKKRSRKKIAQQVEDVGARLSPFSGYNSFGLKGRCLSSDVSKVLTIAVDCLLRSTFPQQQIAIQKKLQLAALLRSQESPFFLAQQAMRDSLFPGHPYQWTSHGTSKAISDITRADIATYHRNHLGTDNLVVAVFGDITQAQAIAILQKRLASIPQSAHRPALPPPPTPELPARHTQTSPKEQSILLLGFPGVSIKDPRLDALSILKSAMSGLSSDLLIEIRDKRGLVYYAGAYQHAGMAPGAYIMYAGTQKKSLSEAEKLMMDEIKRVTGKGIRQNELDRARKQMVAAHEMGLQNNSSTAMSCALNELYGLGFDYSFTLKERLQNLTTAQIKAAAASVLTAPSLSVSIVHPKTQPKTAD